MCILSTDLPHGESSDTVAAHLRSRFFRILFAVAWFAWTGVIIPGHTRGIIPVAGSNAAASAPAPSCCETSAEHSKDKKSCPPTANCAICELAVKLSGPIVITLELKPLGLLELLPPPAPSTFVRCEPPLIQSCRDPPAVRFC